jgi:hypothetical protein
VAVGDAQLGIVRSFHGVISGMTRNSGVEWLFEKSSAAGLVTRLLQYCLSTFVYRSLTGPGELRRG